MHFAILGPPASGKGTISSWITQDYGSAQIATGDLLRQRALVDDAFGQQIKALLAGGGLLNDDLVFSLLKEELERIGTNSWYLDGFPRTKAQCEALDKFILNSSMGKRLDFVMSIHVPKETLIQRMNDRWIHPASGRVYSLSFHPPITPNVDDVTGEPLVHRSDDNSKAFARRLDAYAAQSDLIKDYYGTERFIEVTGKSSKEIYARVQEIFARIPGGPRKVPQEN